MKTYTQLELNQAIVERGRRQTYQVKPNPKSQKDYATETIFYININDNKHTIIQRIFFDWERLRFISKTIAADFKVWETDSEELIYYECEEYDLNTKLNYRANILDPFISKLCGAYKDNFR